MMFTIYDKIRESNRIEGIHRDPTPAEVAEFKRFMYFEKLTIGAMQGFVEIYAPGAHLRDQPGLDVRVGRYTPPAGGVKIPYELDHILSLANGDVKSPWQVHCEYERLHPFTDGNGRSGRMLWYWMMVGNPLADLGFLHAFYYQTLQNDGQ